MATLKVREYAAGAVVAGHAIPVGVEPAITKQAVTYTIATTVTLDPNTRLVRFKADAKAHFEWDGGAAVVADDDIEANTVEYFGVSPAATEGGSRTFSVYDGTS